MSWGEPRSAEEQAKWERFLHRLDRRYFMIDPLGVPFRGSAMSAKHLAMELLRSMEVGQTVRVINSEGTIWRQTKRNLMA